MFQKTVLSVMQARQLAAAVFLPKKVVDIFLSTDTVLTKTKCHHFLVDVSQWHFKNSSSFVYCL